MTGLLDRLRAWLGSVFGGGSSDQDGTGDDPDPDSRDRRVVHRDDRPLETPSTLERGRADREASRTTGTGDQVEIPDAEGDGPETVSIPDAEAVGEGEGDAPSPAAEPEESTPTPTDRSAAAELDDPEARDASGETGVADSGADADFACSVCGTTVDEPSDPCPLCRSTDVVPVADAADVEAEEPLTRGGRTAVSTADDDEAVDRLHDVRDEG